MEQRIVKIAQLSHGKTPFIDWIESLDKVTKSRVQSRPDYWKTTLVTIRKLIMKYQNSG